MHESRALQAVPFDAKAAQPEMQELLLAVMEPTLPVEAVGVKPKRGQPEKISQAHLWLSLVWSALLGMSSYHDWWRLFCTKTVGRFAPKLVSVDALVARFPRAPHVGATPPRTKKGFFRREVRNEMTMGRSKQRRGTGLQAIQGWRFSRRA